MSGFDRHMLLLHDAATSIAIGPLVLGFVGFVVALLVCRIIKWRSDGRAI